jgi:hypothetical protein
MALDFLLFIQCLHSERTHYKLYKSKATLFLINHHAIEVHQEVKTHLKNLTWVGGQLHAQAAFFFHSATAHRGPGSPHYRGFTIILRHTTLGRTPLDEWSARRRDLYLTTHNIHKRQTSMLLAGFEPAIPPSERPQTHALDRAATGIDPRPLYPQENSRRYPMNRTLGPRVGVDALKNKKLLLVIEIDSSFVHPSHYTDRATPTP